MILEELVEAVRAIEPELLDPREAAAIVESLGYNDGAAAEEFGLDNTLELGQLVYGDLAHAGEGITLPHEHVIQASEMREFWRSISTSLAYALPWISLFLLQKRMAAAVSLSPELGGALGLALMFSLIVSGGFVQIIARKGRFYCGLEQGDVADYVCTYFLRLGAKAAVLAGAFALILNLYVHIYTFLIAAAAVAMFLGLCILWMVCAMLSVDEAGWRIPTILLCAGLSFAGGRHAHIAVSGDLFISVGTALFTSVGLALLSRRGGLSARVLPPDLPRFDVLLSVLLPYAAYGFLYFGFMFADRIAAGFAVPWSSGLSFGIDATYKNGMDIALAGLLLSAGVVEYAGGLMMRSWIRRCEAPRDGLGSFLLRRWAGFVLLLTVTFLASSACFTQLAAYLGIVVHSMMRIVVVGQCGYLLLTIALFNCIILFSISQPMLAIRPLAVALTTNLFFAYTLSHVFGLRYASIGLLCGGVVLCMWTSFSVLEVLRSPEYSFSKV